MKKLLVHIGLPKTATTSLQENVLMQLHSDGKINFLGKDNFSKFYPASNITSKLRSCILTESEIFFLKEEFDALLDNKLINVISEEDYSTSRNKDLHILWGNFRRLLVFYDTTILVNLRKPTDFIFSYYVESFRWKYQFDNMNNTFAKFIASASRNIDDAEYYSIFYNKLFSLFSNFKVKVILFEDLKYDNDFYEKEFSSILQVKKEVFSTLFYANHKNQKKKVKGGSFSDSTTLNQYFNILLRFLNDKASFLKVIPFHKYLVKAFFRVTSKIKVSKPVKHLLPEDYESFIRGVVITKDYRELISKLNICEEKLKSYGYL